LCATAMEANQPFALFDSRKDCFENQRSRERIAA
jgi:hypothetical protein